MLMPTAKALSLYKILLLFTELCHWPAYRPTVRIRPILGTIVLQNISRLVMYTSTYKLTLATAVGSM
jgi:hypothetical protein